MKLNFTYKMKTRQKLEDENAEKIIQLLEYGAALNWFSSDNTPFRFEDFMEEEINEKK